MSKRLAKVIAMGMLIIMSLSVFAGCGDKILKEFDLSDPTDFWEGTTVEDLASGGNHGFPAMEESVYITFKKTSSYPILKIEDLKHGNIKYFQYLLSNPDELGDSYWEHPENNIEDYRQYAAITLKEPGHEKVLEMIRHLESLKFIKRAYPAFPNQLEQ